MMIHVITGAPCSGKTTYVDKNAQEGDIIVDYNKLAQAFGHNDTHGASGNIAMVTLKAWRAAIDYILKNDFEAWICHTNPRGLMLEEYEKAGAEILNMDPGKDVCLERAEADGRPETSIDFINEYYENIAKDSGMNEKKDMTIEVKEAKEDGIVLAYASTTHREPDSYGDIVAPGAFDRTLAEWRESGNTIPVLFAHDGADVWNNVGGIIEAHEDDYGLLCQIKLDLENDNAAYLYKLIQEKRISKLSFAYSVIQCELVTLEDGTRVRELQELKLHEVSFVTTPANQHTCVVSVKSDDGDKPEDYEVDPDVEGNVDIDDVEVIAPERDPDQEQDGEKADEEVEAKDGETSDEDVPAQDEEPALDIEEDETIEETEGDASAPEASDDGAKGALTNRLKVLSRFYRLTL